MERASLSWWVCLSWRADMYRWPTGRGWVSRTGRHISRGAAAGLRDGCECPSVDDGSDELGRVTFGAASGVNHAMSQVCWRLRSLRRCSFMLLCPSLTQKLAEAQVTGEAANKIFEQRAKLAAIETAD